MRVFARSQYFSLFAEKHRTEAILTFGGARKFFTFKLCHIESDTTQFEKSLTVFKPFNNFFFL